MAASADGTVAPEKFSLTLGGDNEREWKVFKQKFQIYLLASEKGTKPEETKVALLLNIGGDELLQIYNSFEFPAPGTGNPNPANVLASVIAKFDEYFAPRKNELVSRYRFRKCIQKSDETLEAYVTRLKILIKDCNYDDQRDKQLRDQVVFGCLDDKLRQKLFEVDDLTLQKTLDTCVAFQASRRQMDAYKNENSNSSNSNSNSSEGIAKVRDKSWKEKRHDRKSESHMRAHSEVNRSKEKGSDVLRNNSNFRACKFCGQNHEWKKGKCPASGKKCSRCGKLNHFSVKCRSNMISYVNDDDSIYSYDNNDMYFQESEESDTEYLLKLSSKNDKLVKADFEVEGEIIKFQVDCGASVSVIPHYLIPNAILSPCDTTLEAWCLSTVKPKGKCRLTIRNCKNKKKYSVEFLVVEGRYTPLLSKRTSEQMGLITVNYENISATCDILDKYAVFDNNSVGTFHDIVHLTVNPDIDPVVVSSWSHWSIPVTIKKKVCNKLKELEKLNVITKVDEPTDWVSRMTTAEKKSGDLRICIDPHFLNRALKREHHPIPVIDDILPQLSKAKVFSSFDLKNGYWHCVLDRESSLLTTFQTPIGRFRWLRLPFGLKVSSEIFQKQLHVNLENLEGVVCIADDILVFGVGDTHDEALRDHDLKLNKFLQRCQEKGIKLNKSKAVLRKTEISFLGHRITNKGLKADPNKIEAIVNMEAPTDVTGVRRLSGMVNYLSKFMPNLSSVMEPIRKLMHHGVEWNWSEEQEKAFKALKCLITKSPILQYYDPNLELVIQCDASQSGLGSVLLQDGKPIAYASRAMTETEKRYAQIEKETLAIVFSLNKFHQYVYGRQITVESDHKPLSSIVLKPVCNAPRRLQGMLLNILPYDIAVVHKKGSEMYIADTLSRAYLPLGDNNEIEFERVNMLDYLPIRKERFAEIRAETEKDESLQLLKRLILNGWPDEYDKIPIIVKAYCHTKDEFSVQDGLIFKSNRIVIPLNLRDKFKRLVHSSHIGIEGCLRRARECIYWPGMNSDIKQFILACDVCNKYPNSQQKESLMCHEIADRPWQKVGVDLMSIKKHNYLVTVDYFSNFFEIDYLNNTLSTTVIRKLKAHFARYGLPSVLISDNGPQFVSDEFKHFSIAYDFEHRTSSPTHAQSNGMVESAVKTSKRLITKAVESGRDPYLAILDYRNTPTADKGASPAQYCLGRRSRTKLPMLSKMLECKNVDSELAREKKRLSNAKSKWYYDKNSKDLDILHEGVNVRMKPHVLGKKDWENAKVIERLDERSYLIESDGKMFRRNRVDLRETPNIEQESPTEINIPINVSNNDSCQKEKLNVENVPSERPARSTRNKLPSRFTDFNMS